jgi:hypothetical protein
LINTDIKYCLIIFYENKAALGMGKGNKKAFVLLQQKLLKINKKKGNCKKYFIL